MSRTTRRWILAILGCTLLAVTACGGVETSPGEGTSRATAGGDGPVVVRTLKQTFLQAGGQRTPLVSFTDEFSPEEPLIDVYVKNKNKTAIFLDGCNSTVIQKADQSMAEISEGPGVEITWPELGTEWPPTTDVLTAPPRECWDEPAAIAIGAGRSIYSTTEGNGLIRHGFSKLEPGLYRVVLKYKAGCVAGQTFSACKGPEETTHATFWARD